jgi:hypothetical protein
VGELVEAPETIPGPDQLQVIPGVVELAVIVPLVVVHVSVSGGPAVTLGNEPVLVTVTEAVLVQPLAGSVTVTLYVPAAFTVGDEVVPPEIIPGPDQFHVTPETVELALMVPVGDEQVSVMEEPGVISGGVVFEVTETLAVLVQPLDGSVTVTE